MVQFKFTKSGNRFSFTVLITCMVLSFVMFSSCGKNENKGMGSIFEKKENSEYDEAMREASEGGESSLNNKENNAIIELPDTVIDLGDIKKGLDSQRKATFKFYNRGSDLLVIQKVEAYCACTQAEWTQEPIEPDDNGIIEVTFDADLMQGRRFMKNLQVISNAKNGPQLIKVKGTISY